MKQRDFSILFAICLFSACGRQTEETKPVRKDITQMVFASGVLEANNTYNLTVQTDGYLVNVDFEEGDLLEAGQTAAVIDNRENIFNKQSAAALYEIAKSNTDGNAPEIAKAKTAMELARQKLAVDSVQYIRYKTLYGKNSVSKTEYETYYLQFSTARSDYNSALEVYRLARQQARQELISSQATKNINAQLSAGNQLQIIVGGKVYKKSKQTGDYVRKGDAIATLGDADYLYARVNIDESNIGKVKPGQQAIIRLNTNKEKIYKGKVAEIYPSFDEASQTFTCKIIFTDPLDFRVAGTQLQSNIIISNEKEALLIPRNYLDFDGTIMLKKDRKKHLVKTNFIGKDWVQVTSGIDEHSELITGNIPANSMNTSELGAQMR